MIAKVNETVITEADVQQEVQNIVAQMQNEVSPEQLQQMMPRLNKEAVENLINRILLIAEAERKNLHPTPEDIKAQLDNIISRFPSLETFQQQMEKNGISMEIIENDIKMQLKISMMVKESLSNVNISVTDEEIKKFFDENPGSFKIPEQVHASHILFKIDSKESDAVKSQKRLEIAGLLGQLEKGADFEKMAKKHSECPSSQQGGNLGFFERGKMVKPFEDAAFSLEKGGLSDIVESPFGFHLIKVHDHNEAHDLQLNEVSEKIREHLVSTHEQQAFGNYLIALRESAQIEYAEAQ